ncbi:putative signal peptidase complex subunit 1 [Diplonema papillatum]|nr:putative signal peptidase complex subunit 1 [Diplonema papillatum]
MPIIAEKGISLHGQKKCEQVMQWMLWISGACGMLVGAVTQSAALMMYVICAGIGITCMVVCPPWGCWGEEDIKWVPTEVVDAWVADEYKMEMTEKAKKSGTAAAEPVTSPTVVSKKSGLTKRH